jgi:hypothetical protein
LPEIKIEFLAQHPEEISNGIFPQLSEYINQSRSVGHIERISLI